MLLNKFMHFTREGISPQAQVIGLNRVFVPQLVAAFDDPPMRRSICDDPDLRIRSLKNLRPRNERPCALELAIQPLHVVFVIVRALAVVRFVVMAAASRKVGCSRMIRSRQRAVAYAVAIQIPISCKTAKLVQ